MSGYVWIGYAFSVDITINGLLDPLTDEATFVGSLKFNRNDVDTLFDYSSEAGSITRLSGNSIRATVPAEVTIGLSPGFVYADFVRTDTSAPQHLGFIVVAKVVQPLTPAP